ncbi:MAG: ribosomal protection-like ABC-F family protein [Sphaerochaetaceae bacterium]
MNTLQLSGICLSFGDRDLLQNVSFTIDSRTRAALAGGNGEGKSTLMKIACSQVNADSGTITKTKGIRISYLPQSDIVLGSNSVYEEIEKAFDRSKAMLARQSELGAMLETDPSGKALVDEIHEIQEKLNHCGYYSRKTTIGVIAQGLGFKPHDMERPCSEFSGGYQMRIALARTLAGAPDILLLDEPTNYLDIDARIWLRSFIRQFDGGVMIVSHDRGFLDETVNEVYELFNGTLTRCKGNYTQYETLRQDEIARLEAAYRKQQLEIEHAETFIERFRYKAAKSRQVQSRIKMLEKLEPVVIPSHLKKLSFSFPEPPHSPNGMVVIENMTKSYGDNIIYEGFNLIVSKGDRLAVAGQNGKGKSTLLRLIAGTDKDYQGTIRLGPGVITGYFAQDNETELIPGNTVLDEISSHALTSQLPELRSMLGSFLFSNDDIYKKVDVLSGGEKSRLALLKILLKPASLLILDEPTNHMDINSQEMLLQALRKYQGTLIFVSHDSYFISRLANKILYLSDEKPQLFAGDYEYFSWKLEQKDSFASAKSAGDSQIPQKKAEMLDYKTANKLKNQRQRLESQARSLLEEANLIKCQIDDLDREIAKPENYSNPVRITELIKSKQRLETAKDEKENKWLEISEELEDE